MFYWDELAVLDFLSRHVYPSHFQFFKVLSFFLCILIEKIFPVQVFLHLVLDQFHNFTCTTHLYRERVRYSPILIFN